MILVHRKLGQKLIALEDFINLHKERTLFRPVTLQIAAHDRIVNQSISDLVELNQIFVNATTQTSHISRDKVLSACTHEFFIFWRLVTFPSSFLVSIAWALRMSDTVGSRRAEGAGEGEPLTTFQKINTMERIIEVKNLKNKFSCQTL